jgi:hypothetical protein
MTQFGVIGNLILVAVLAVIVFLFMLSVRPAPAHRMSSHDYRVAHWCQWSAATVCTRWRARGGKFICPPGNMSMSCRLQRREAR